MNLKSCSWLPLIMALCLLANGGAHGETVQATVRGDEDGGVISRHLYGHFAEHLGRCIYGGMWVGVDSPIPNTDGVRTDIIDALKKIHAPNLRWPGGCFADDYHWRDGVGPRDRRPRSTNIHWGQVTESNAFGTHEFMGVCEAIGAEPYLAGNVGSGTPQEMRDWLEYLTFDGDSQLAIQRSENGRETPWKVPFFGIGNENWGCGGDMTVEYYSDLYRRYSVFCRDFSDNRLNRVGCGPGSYDEHWIRVMMKKVGGRMQGLSLHKYTLAAPWNNKLPATGFGEKEWFAILNEGIDMDRFLTEADELMDETDPEKRIKIYLDEWGAWYREEPGTPDYGLYQQNTLRDALLAGLNFHIFHEHTDRLAMANIAQTVNVLQALILTKDEKMLLTPTYHVFDMYQVHHDATRLPVEFESPRYEFEGRSMPAVSLSASRDKAGRVHVSLVNAHAREGFDLDIKLPGIKASEVSGRILTAEKLDEHNTFESPQKLIPKTFDGAKVRNGNLEVKLPPRSVVVLELKNS